MALNVMVSLEVMISPPPETVAVVETGVGAFGSTFIVNKIGG